MEAFTLRYSNIAMKNSPFEDVFLLQNGDIRACYVSLPEGNSNFRFGAIQMLDFLFQEVRRVQRSHSLPSGVTLTIIDSQPASKVRGGQWME